MYHFSGMPLKVTIAPSICKPRLTLAIAFADSTDGLTDATSNSGGGVEVWLKTAKQLTDVRRTHRIACIPYVTILPLEKIHGIASAEPQGSSTVNRRAIGVVSLCR